MGLGDVAYRAANVAIELERRTKRCEALEKLCRHLQSALELAETRGRETAATLTAMVEAERARGEIRDREVALLEERAAAMTKRASDEDAIERRLKEYGEAIESYEKVIASEREEEGKERCYDSPFSCLSHTFVALDDMSGESGQKSHMYVASLFWAVQTLTTVGYGNVVPTTVAERVVAILVMITGGFVFSAIISGVNMTMDEDSPGNRFAVLMNHVRELLAENKMPSGLQSRVRSHYKSSAKPAKLVNRDIIKPLPEAIRADVNFYIYGKPMVTGLTASGTVEPDSIVIEILCRTMDTKMFARGSRMCYPYELAERMLITLTGRVTYSPDEQSGFHHADVMRIKRKRLRDQQIEIAEEKGLLRGPGTLLNPGLLSGFHKGILCAMPFDKYVEALVLDHGAFYDMCSQHQPNLLRNFEDEFFASLSRLNRPKMARVALSECDRRALLHPETRNVAENWRELLEKERKEQDEKRAEREKAGVMGLVNKGGLEAIDSKAMSGGGTPGATMGAIKLAMQQMHADIVNVSEQIAEVMVEVKKVGSMGEESALNTSQIVMSADAIEKKQINM
ncbi:Two pore domain potassium channel domain, partial [Ostreococcus tauri]